MSSVKRFVVERARWIRGGGCNTRLLRSEDGHMCCLGFVCRQLGADAAIINDRGDPADINWTVIDTGIRKAIEPLARFVDDEEFGERLSNTQLATDAININDDRTLFDAEREHKLSALFASHGYSMEFVP